MAKETVELIVQRSEWLSRHMVRVFLGGPGFASFTPNGFTDAYVKLVFGTDDEPVLRTYTVRSIDEERQEIALDFVVHGDDGVAGPWAAGVQPGEHVRLRGPGGAFRPDPDADWYLLAGDESAVPAIAAALEALPESALGYAYIEVEADQDELTLVAPRGVHVQWLHRGEPAASARPGPGGDGAPLVAAVRNAQWLAGTPHVFVHGEADTVMKGLRPYIRKERGVPADRASISGYWRRGRTEEGFRVWKREVAEAEKVG